MSITATAALTLEVTSQQAGALGLERRKTFGPEGGTIGRAAGNRWVLADAYVSNKHASIAYRDGEFWIEDSASTNGVFVNDSRVEPRQPRVLASGDRIFIEPYEMVVSIANQAAGPIATMPTAAAGHGIEGLQPHQFDAPGGDDLWEPAAGGAGHGVLAAVESTSWLDNLAPPLPDLPAPGNAGVGRVGSDLLKEHYSAPVVVVQPQASRVPAPPVIPENYDPLTAEPTPIPPVPHPVVERAVADPPRSNREDASPCRSSHRQTLPETGSADGSGRAGFGDGADVGSVADLLAGAGLVGLTVSPEVAKQLGQILRVVVAGVLDVLQARQEVKGEFRIRNTIIQSRRNNPLKHSVDVEDALHNLLVKRSRGYLGPVEAFEDAFNDLRYHQLAMLAGVRVAFEGMFGKFDPARLQKEFDRHSVGAKKGAIASAFQGKPDYWDFYREWVQRLARDSDGSFRALFGDEFAKAYEEQLDRLKARIPTDRHRLDKGDGV